MKINRETSIELQFEVGKKYTTKFQTRERFTISRIIFLPKTNRITGFEGIYETKPHLGICPLGSDRLIPDTIIESKTVEVCDKCGKEI